MKFTIIPSIIASSQSELEERMKKISSTKSKLVHLDVMDGQFVSRTSLEFNLKLPKSTKYEAHLMVQDPQPWIMHNLNKVKTFIVHYKSGSHLHQLIADLKKYKKKIGIALNPEDPHEDISQYLKLVDKVLVMTVNPGKYGSPFLKEMLHKIRHIRNLNAKIDIEVDGGINENTIKLCRAAGANQFVVGSYLQNSKDVKKAWKELSSALNFKS